MGYSDIIFESLQALLKEWFVWGEGENFDGIVQPVAELLRAMDLHDTFSLDVERIRVIKEHDYIKNAEEYIRQCWEEHQEEEEQRYSGF